MQSYIAKALQDAQLASEYLGVSEIADLEEGPRPIMTVSVKKQVLQLQVTICNALTTHHRVKERGQNTLSYHYCQRQAVAADIGS